MAGLIVILALVTVLLVFRIPQRAVAKVKSRLNNTVIVNEEKVDIDNLDKPFKIIFIADTHVALCDDRDEEVREKTDTRYLDFIVDSKSSAENFEELFKYIRKAKPDLVILGGDITDSATYESIEFVEKQLDKLECPYVYITGNHDFEYGSEYFSETAYSEYLPRLRNITDVNNGYQVMEFDQFTILGVDDGSNQVCDDIGKGIAEAKEIGKPVILVTHVPFVPFVDKEELIQRTNDVWGGMDSGDSRTLMGYGGIMPNGSTQELMGFIAEDDSLVKLVLAGHVHFYHKDALTNNVYQVITGAGYQRSLVEVTLY